MRSHFNPSVRSTGSAPNSRRDGSNSIGSGSVSARSLARTGSISSDERRRHHANSPTLSAFGYSQLRSSPLSNGSSSTNRNRLLFDDPSSSSSILPTIGSPPSAYVTPDKTNTIRSVGSGSAATVMDNGTVRGVELVRTGSTSQFSALSAPWAAGLDNDWVPAA